MKKEEAISVLDGVLSDFCSDCPMMYEENCDCEAKESIDMAIKSLQSEESLKTQLANCHKEILRLLDLNDTAESQNDVIEVVRCGDCRHYEDGLIGYCWEVDRGVSKDFFCAYGERLSNDKR